MAQEFPTICGPCSSPPEPPVPEGLVLIRDSYQFEDAKYPMIGFTPDSDGPHKLIVLLGGNDQGSTGVSADRAFTLQRRALERTVATQGHGMVILGYSGATNYPDTVGTAEFFGGDFSGSRAKVCEEWVRQGAGVIAGINKLCARNDFDCSSGIALFGYSQGAAVAVQTSKLYTGVNALLSGAWAPLLGAGAPAFETINPPHQEGPYLLPPHRLALHWCGFDDADDDPPTWSTFVPSVSADKYPPALSTFVNKTKRLSLISAQDHHYGNPTEDPAATAPIFSLQRDFSGYYECPDSQNDCTQADGSGYYVVPAGVIPAEPNPTWRAWDPDRPMPWPIHQTFLYAFVDDAFIGEKWHADAALKWLGNAAFGA